LGEIEQTPPMYSAVKFKGKKLYELARKGKEVTVGAKRINIKRLEITGIELPEITFRILCSKGTYVRRLCMDIGDALGCGAYLSRLRRIASGAFSEAGTIEFEKIRAMETDALAARLLKR
jgi:tRNA pseudouridine55 synthase